MLSDLSSFSDHEQGTVSVIGLSLLLYYTAAKEQTGAISVIGPQMLLRDHHDSYQTCGSLTLWGRVYRTSHGKVNGSIFICIGRLLMYIVGVERIQKIPLDSNGNGVHSLDIFNAA